MAIDLDEQDGQPPLDPDEKAGLIPEHLATKGDLNDWEQENILRAVRWLKRARVADVLSEGFCRTLHAKMFGLTWSWAGTFRNAVEPLKPKEAPIYLGDHKKLGAALGNP